MTFILEKLFKALTVYLTNKDVVGIMKAKLGTAKLKALREQVEATARPMECTMLLLRKLLWAT